MNPTQPAKLVYLLLENWDMTYSSEIYLQALFIPSEMTRSVYQIQPVSRNFDEALDRWALNQKTYKDQYGFQVPFGKFNPNLQVIKDRTSGVDQYLKQDQFASPRKRTQDALNRMSIGEEIKRQNFENEDRPSIDEKIFIFQKLVIYLHNEAKNKALQTKQEFLWQNYMQQLTELMMEEEIPEDEARTRDELDEIRSQNTVTSYKYSIASRSTRWETNSW